MMDEGEKDAAMRRLEGQIAEKDAAMRRLEDQIAEKDAAMRQLEDQIAKMQEKIDDLTELLLSVYMEKGGGARKPPAKGKKEAGDGQLSLFE